ncbi:hypothetical protein [Dickeya dadantii]|uniref:hypothetical protein n=1 Tax=Dickeya dadantii TaxID=204038 RepID=UPI0021DAF2E0|nr:hypothetical protein [Dickeya dadantii]
MRQIIPASPVVSHTQHFCQQILPDTKPIWVKSEPLPGAPEKDCFQIVSNHTEQHGGKEVIGWAIWEMPGVYIEAEFHCIWQDPAGGWHDLTPYPYHYDNILFLPDHTRFYSGRQVDNFRQALVDDREVCRWLHLAKRRFEIMNTGDLADQHGLIELPPKLAKEYEKIIDEVRKLNSRLERRYP